jgi:chromosome segregation ATPase
MDYMQDPYQDTGDKAAIMHIQCEKFEIELNSARAEIEGLNFALKQASSIYDAAAEQRDGLRSCIDYASDQLHKVTEQRDEARRLAEKYRNLSCDSQDEADETLLPWEITNPNEL